jgi:CDP-diacylglycerol--glycerol-3-phosphate 3-phosphatidyltransferase
VEILYKHIPNMLSGLRIFLIIPFIYSLAYDDMPAVVLIAVTMILTDYFDGFLARRWNIESETGRILDPLADKICVASVGLVLVFLRGFPPLLLIAMIARDLGILLTGLLVIRNRSVVPVSNILGKITAGVMAACLLVYLFEIGFLKAPAVIITIIMLVVSSLSYIIELRESY